VENQIIEKYKKNPIT